MHGNFWSSISFYSNGNQTKFGRLEPPKKIIFLNGNFEIQYNLNYYRSILLFSSLWYDKLFKPFCIFKWINSYNMKL